MVGRIDDNERAFLKIELLALEDSDNVRNRSVGRPIRARSRTTLGCLRGCYCLLASKNIENPPDKWVAPKVRAERGSKRSCRFATEHSVHGPSATLLPQAPRSRP